MPTYVGPLGNAILSLVIIWKSFGLKCCRSISSDFLYSHLNIILYVAFILLQLFSILCMVQLY